MCVYACVCIYVYIHTCIYIFICVHKGHYPFNSRIFRLFPFSSWYEYSWIDIFEQVTIELVIKSFGYILRSVMLGHRVHLFLAFCETSILISWETKPLYSRMNSKWGFAFAHILKSFFVVVVVRCFVDVKLSDYYLSLCEN